MAVPSPTAVCNGPVVNRGLRSLEPLTMEDDECENELYRGQGRRMADLPALQEGAAGAEIQAAWVAEQHHGVLVPLLWLSLEHFHHV